MQLRHTTQFKATVALGSQPQQVLYFFLCRLEVLFGIGQHGLQIQGGHPAGGLLHQYLQSLLGVIDLALYQQQFDDCGLPFLVGWIDLQRFLISRQRASHVALGVQQQVTTQLQRFSSGSGLPRHLVQPDQSGFDIAGQGAGARQLQQGGCVIGLGLERLVQALTRLVLLALALPCNGHIGLQIGLRLFTVQLLVRVVVGDLVKLPGLQQGLHQLRHDVVGGCTQILRLLEFGFSALSVTSGKQGLAQHEACLDEIRALLQGVLELDDGRWCVLSIQVVLRRCNQGIGIVSTAGRHQQGDCQGSGRESTAGNRHLHHHVVLHREPVS